jgi:hypothetical protein
MEEVARNLVVAIQEGTFEPHRENDELIRALQTQNTLDEPAASAWSHGKLLGPEIARTRLIAKVKQNRRTNFVP